MSDLISIFDWWKQNESTAFTRARDEQKKGLRAKNIPDCGINAHDTYHGVAGDPDLTKKKPKKKKK